MVRLGKISIADTSIALPHQITIGVAFRSGIRENFVIGALSKIEGESFSDSKGIKAQTTKQGDHWLRFASG